MSFEVVIKLFIPGLWPHGKIREAKEEKKNSTSRFIDGDVGKSPFFSSRLIWHQLTSHRKSYQRQQE